MFEDSILQIVQAPANTIKNLIFQMFEDSILKTCAGGSKYSEKTEVQIV